MERVSIGLVLAIAMATTAYAETQIQQFDLVCDTTTEVYGYTASGNRIDSGEPTKASVRLSIDLIKGEWCETEYCGRTGAKPIAEVTSTTITLGQGPGLIWAINRTEGTYRKRREDSRDVFIDEQGPCRREAFTTFPVAKF